MTAESTIEIGRRLLEKCDLFSALDESSRRELSSHGKRRTYPAGESICRIGDEGHTMMAVIVGAVRISITTSKGREMILADLPAGQLFGEIAMFDGKPRSAHVTALTNCELFVLERRDVLQVLGKNPAACWKVIEILCARIRRSNERVAEIAFFDLPARLARTLLEYPGQSRGPSKISLSQRELAEMAGGTRENVNRCLRDWHKRGIVELKDRWTIILQPDALRAMAADM